MAVPARLMTVDEAAERLGVRASTVRRRILERRIAYCKIGRSVRIPVEAVESLIKEGYRAPVSAGDQESKR